MPIVGLTDDILGSFPRLGVIKKGAPKPENGIGRELPYFRFIAGKTDIQEEFERCYGKEPKTLRAFMAYATLERTWETWCEIWSGNKTLVHRCDGKTMVRWLDGDHYVNGSKPCTGGHKDNDPLNDARGRLYVIFPELVNAGFAGYVTVNTGGKYDIVSITEVLTAVADANNGSLSGIPFILERVPEKISTPGYGDRKGQRSIAEKFNIKISPDAEWLRVMLELKRHAALQGGQPAQAALPEPEYVDIDEEAPYDVDFTDDIVEHGEVLLSNSLELVTWAKNVKSTTGQKLGDAKLPDLHKINEWYKLLKPNQKTKDVEAIYKAANILIEDITERMDANEQV